MLDNDSEYRGWLQQEVKDLRNELEAQGLDSTDVEPLVAALIAKEESEINNGGLSAQLLHLLKNGVSSETIKKQLCNTIQSQ